MNKIVSVLIVLVLFSQHLLPQCTSWKVQRQGDGGAYSDIQFIDSLHGWISRAEGQTNAPLLRTKDGGKTWNAVDIITTFGKITSISFIDTLNGWAGAGWQMLRTRDGGKTWKIIHELSWLGSKPFFSKIYFTDSLHGWSIGGDTIGVNATRIFRTTDGGNIWSNQQLLNINVFQIEFIDSLRGWIAGRQILHTVDGGKTWAYQIFDSTILGSFPGITKITFLDSLNGWACINKHAWILHTSNGGKTWETIGKVDSVDTGLYMESIAFVDTVTGWAFGETFNNHGIVSSIYKTINGGKKWERVSIGLASEDVFASTFIDQCHLWVLMQYGDVLTVDNTTSVARSNMSVPETISLSQNYPNPFNPSTSISFTIPQTGLVTIKIFDLLGNEISTVVDRSFEAGSHVVQFVAKGLSSGDLSMPFDERCEYSSAEDSIGEMKFHDVIFQCFVRFLVLVILWQYRCFSLLAGNGNSAYI